MRSGPLKINSFTAGLAAATEFVAASVFAFIAGLGTAAKGADFSVVRAATTSLPFGEANFSPPFLAVATGGSDAGRFSTALATG